MMELSPVYYRFRVKQMFRPPHVDVHKKELTPLILFGLYFWLNFVKKVPAPY